MRMVFRDFFNGGEKIEQDLGEIEKNQFELMCLVTIKKITCNPLNKEID